MALFTILVTIAMLLPAMPVLANGGGGGGGLQAICVPWQPANHAIPHYTYSGASTTLKGIARGGATQFYWEFGDGSPDTAWTLIGDPYNLGISHTYTGSIGTLFIATLHVKDASNNIVQDSYPVQIYNYVDPSDPVQLDVKINMSIDAGLWYLHTSLHRSVYGSGAPGYGQPYGYWDEPTWGTYYPASTGAAVDAFQLHGSKLNGDYNGDPYVEDVQLGMNYLFTQILPNPIGPQNYPDGVVGNPDTNGNGIGLAVSSGEQTYEGGIILVAMASSGVPNYIAPTGDATYVHGQTLKTIVQDQVDYFAWGQCNNGYAVGGWRYTGDSQDADMSTTQWPVLGMTAAEQNMGCTVPAFVRTELAYWVAYCQYNGKDGNNGGFGYNSNTYILNLTKAAAGIICLQFLGVPITDPRIESALGYIYRHWNDSVYWDWPNEELHGCSYEMYAVMKAMRIPEPDITRVTEYDYNSGTQTANSFDWYYKAPDANIQEGLAYYTVFNQQADGQWNDWIWPNPVRGPFSTAWRVLVLLKGVNLIPPVAVVTPYALVGGVVTPITGNVIFAENEPINLTAMKSYHPDPNRIIVLYEWDLDNNGQFNDASGLNVTLPGKPAGDYTIKLRVIDDTPGNPQTDVVTYIIKVRPPCLDPIAVAGGPYLGSINQAVQLNGSGSWDPDGSITKYEWDLDGDGVFDDANGVQPSFTWTTPFTGQIALKVTDDGCHVPGGDQNGWAGFSIATANVEIGHHNPVSVPGGPYTAKSGQTITLNGSGSYSPDSLAITYSWDLNNDGTFGDSTSANTSFSQIAPIGTVFDVKLMVTDTLGGYDIKATSIKIIANQPPIANAGPDQTVFVSALVSLNGSGSTDANGDPLTYSWSIVSKPAGSATTLNNPITVNPTFVADKFGSYVVQLIVNDGEVNSAPDTITIKTANLPPTANAGPDQTVEQTSPAGANATLNGTASSDVDGDPLTYAWSWTGGSATGATPSVSLPAGTTTITLTVTDVPYGATGTDTVDITVRDTIAPAVTPPPDVTVTVSSVPTAVTIGTAGATDAVGVTSLTSNAPATFNAGDTYVIWTARDAAGNPGTATQKVTVILTGGLGQAIKMSKEAVVGSNGTTVTCTVVIENNASSGYPLTIESVYDLVYHYSAGIDNVTIVPTVEYPVFTLAAGDNTTLTFTYEKATGDEDQEVMDTIVARGYHTLPSGRHIFAGAIESASITFPVPELSAGVLFGLGALGLAGFILLRRKSAALKT